LTLTRILALKKGINNMLAECDSGTPC
jgi:hypothetical protein